MADPPGKVPDPYTLSLVACDEIIIDMASKRPTLVNVLREVVSAQYPALHPKLSIFAELTNGHGRSVIEARMIHSETDQRIVEFKGEIEFSNPLFVAAMWFSVYNIVLPKSGEYRIQLFSNESLLIERRFIAIEKEAEDESSPDA